MSARQLERRLSIIEKIRSSHYPSLAEIQQYLEARDHRASERTLSQIAGIRDGHGMDVLYSEKERGYYIPETEGNKKVLQLFQHTYNIKLAEVVKKPGFKAGHFLLDEYPNSKGEEHLAVLYACIEDCTAARIVHRKFEDTDATNRTVNPYFIKRYEGRWYLIAKENGQVKTFAFDRIAEIEKTALEFDASDGESVKGMFEDCVGLDTSGQLQEVVLECDGFSKGYLKTLPLHKSQEIIEDRGKNGMKVRLLVRPNSQLMNRILHFGKNIKVLAPEEFAERVRNELREALKKYE